MSELTITRPLDPRVVHRMLSDDGTMATCLHVICLAAYGGDIYKEEPLELFLRLEEDFNAKVTMANESKINAILLATSTDIFYEDQEAFRGICETLTNGDPGLDIVEKLTIPEVLWGLYEVELNHGANSLSPGVQALLDRVITSEGVDMEASGMPDVYAYVWEYLNEIRDRLVSQLAELGVPAAEIPPIQPHGSV